MRERKKRPPRPLQRTLHINGEVWTYRVGKGGGVAIQSPDGVRYGARPHTIKRCTPADYDRDRHQTWPAKWTGITPGDVKTYIETRIV